MNRSFLRGRIRERLIHSSKDLNAAGWFEGTLSLKLLKRRHRRSHSMIIFEVAEAETSLQNISFDPTNYFNKIGENKGVLVLCFCSGFFF
jgi:hypothetical protein